MFLQSVSLLGRQLLLLNERMVERPQSSSQVDQTISPNQLVGAPSLNQARHSLIDRVAIFFAAKVREHDSLLPAAYLAGRSVVVHF